jgi:hypothetical protein
MQIVLNPQVYFDLIVQPAFADIAPGATMYPDTMHLFTMVPNVSLANGMAIVDIFQKQNFLKRKDRSCQTTWSTVGTTGNRKLIISELYAATKFCQEEFYAGPLKDLRNQPEVFRNLAIEILRKGTRADMLTNAYFGDVTRAADAAKVYNWNSFDGIVTQIGKYITAGTIPAAQVMGALPSGALSPSDAVDILEEAFNKRSDIMEEVDESMLEFTVDRKLAEAYQAYLIATGIPSASGPNFLQNGIPVLNYKGIPLYVERTWNPILKALHAGTEAHMCILTMRGNFMFGMDKTYGGGANLDQASRLWYDEDDDVWRNKLHTTGGTEIVQPYGIVFGTTA